MIVYSATKSEFNSDVITNAIADKILNKFQEKLGHTTTKQEIDSWKNSMMYMDNILGDKDILSSAGVTIEYKIPQTSNCIDFILTGNDQHKTDTAIIVELKQWIDVKRTGKDAIVETYLGRGRREVNLMRIVKVSYTLLANLWRLLDEHVLLISSNVIGLNLLFAFQRYQCSSNLCR